MEFSEKLQTLRKQKALTQEELAQVLFVSRTAISKWESGRGTPSIDSLKAISKFFSVSIDDLLSGDQVLKIAEAEKKQTVRQVGDLVFGLLDCGAACLLFLPLFGQKGTEEVRAVSLLALTGVTPFRKPICLALILTMIAVGILTLALQNWQNPTWQACKTKLSLLLNLLGVLLLIVTLQPYAATFLLLMLLIKVLLLLKKR